MKKWCENGTAHIDNPCTTSVLKKLHDETVKNGLSVEIADQNLLAQWQLRKKVKNLREVWSDLIEQISPQLNIHSQRSLEFILSQGNLSERILKAAQGDYSVNRLKSIKQKLADCLLMNKNFQC